MEKKPSKTRPEDDYFQAACPKKRRKGGENGISGLMKKKTGGRALLHISGNPKNQPTAELAIKKG